VVADQLGDEVVQDREQAWTTSGQE